MQAKLITILYCLSLVAVTSCAGSGGGSQSRQVTSRNGAEDPDHDKKSAASAARSDAGATAQGAVDLNSEIPSDPQALMEQLRERESQYLAEKKELASLGRVNEALCQKLNEMKSSCLGRKAISQGAWTEELSCDGSYQKSRGESKISVSIKSPDVSTFRIRINDVYESDVLKAGVSDLLFSSLVDETSTAPLFSNVSKAELMLLSTNSTGKNGSSASVELLVDGQVLISDHIEGLTAGDKKSLSLANLYNELISDRCRMSREALDQMIRDASEGKVASYADSDFINANDEAGSGDESFFSPLNQNDTVALQQRYTQILDGLKELYPKVEGERNRSLKLKNELIGNSGIGCHLKQDIEIIRLTIEGNKIREDVKLNSGSTRQGEGDPETLSVQLGTDIGFSVQNFVGTTVPEINFQGQKLAGISQLILRKMGTSYDNVQKSCDQGIVTGFLKNLTGSNTCYDVYEEHVMSIDSITLEVNGIILFQRNNLNILLNHLHQGWSLPDISKSNPLWAEMLQDTSCQLAE